MRPVLVAASAVVVGGALDGDRGALVVVQVLAVVALLAALLGVPAPRRPRPPAAPAPDGRDRFPAFDRVSAALAASQQSARLVDLQLRPVLARLVAGPLEERGAPAVRAALGEEVWSLVDPARPDRGDSRSGGLDRAALTRVVERLEGL